MFDLIVSLVLTCVVTIVIKLYFGEIGLSSFPVLTFLVITIVSYGATYFIHGLFR